MGVKEKSGMGGRESVWSAFVGNTKAGDGAFMLHQFPATLKVVRGQDVKWFVERNIALTGYPVKPVYKRA